MKWQEIGQEILKNLNVQLSKEQEEVFFDEADIKVIAGGEGGGKSFLAGLYGAVRSVHDYTVNGAQLYWVVGADFEDARKEFGGGGGEDECYLMEWMQQLGVFDRDRSSVPLHRDQKCIMKLRGELAGHTYETVSGYDPLKIGREQPMGILGAEASRWEDELWKRCIGRLSRKRPYSWGFFSGSYEEGFPAFHTYVNMGHAPNPLGLRSYSLPSWANPVTYPGGRYDPAILALEATMSPERFLERHAGRPAQPRDAVFAEFSAALHICPTPIIPNQPVYLFVDPGDNVYSVLFVQFVGQEVWVVDELYVHHWTHEQVVQACQMKEVWRFVGKYGHVMDIAGTQHHFGFSSPVQAWYKDTMLTFNTARIIVEDSIDKIRSVLAISPMTGRPRLRISPLCSGLISEMGGGPSPVIGGGTWKSRGGVPDKRNDHSCKALGYGLTYHFGIGKPGGSEVEDAPSYLRRRTNGSAR